MTSSTMAVDEDPFFFENEGQRLYGILSRPRKRGDGAPRAGLVICDAFAEEKLWSQRTLVAFARSLAAEGWPVLRFDCRGHGDSEGEFEDSSVSTWLSDIDAALQALRDRSGAVSAGLFGLRLGATLAACSAKRRGGPAFLVLCQPVMAGERYFLECLRSNLASQMTRYGRVVKNREQLLQELESGSPVNIDGYLVSSRCREELAPLSLGAELEGVRVPVLLLQVNAAAKAVPDKALAAIALRAGELNPLSEMQVVAEEPFWKELRTYHVAAPRMTESAMLWLRRVDAEGL
jgi:exosortase A-associated hydrolase 2